MYLNGTPGSSRVLSPFGLPSNGKGGPIFRDFQHIQILAAESGDLYMISASYRQPPIASATAALGATPRTRLRAEPAR